MKRRGVSPSRASDLLLVGILFLAAGALLPETTSGLVALAVLTIALIAWPLGLLLWLTRRWARAGDVRFVLLALVLIATAVTGAIVAISLGG